MPASWPRRYETDLSLAGDTLVVGAGVRPPISCGPTDGWSGGHLLLGALNAGLATSFADLVRAAGIELFGYRARALGIMDVVEGRPTFTSFELVVEVEVKAHDGTRVRELMEKAKAQCAVSAALRPALVIRIDIGAVR